MPKMIRVVKQIHTIQMVTTVDWTAVELLIAAALGLSSLNNVKFTWSDPDGCGTTACTVTTETVSEKETLPETINL